MIISVKNNINLMKVRTTYTTEASIINTVSHSQPKYCTPENRNEIDRDFEPWSYHKRAQIATIEKASSTFNFFYLVEYTSSVV